MREADNKSILLSVVVVNVVKTSSLNDMHSCQLFRKGASFFSLVLLSSSVSMANQSCFLAITFSSLRFLFNSPRFNLLRVDSVVFYFLIFVSYPQSSAFLSSVLPSLKLCLL